MFLYRISVAAIMKTIATFTVKVHKTTDTKTLKEETKTYEYGAINIRSPELAKYVGKKVKVRVEEESNQQA